MNFLDTLVFACCRYWFGDEMPTKAPKLGGKRPRKDSHAFPVTRLESIQTDAIRNEVISSSIIDFLHDKSEL